jgi:GT2 family glycosyltransferase
MRALGPVSVVVVNWNGERYLDACLESVAALEGEVGEVIVVDNASTDGSLARLASRHASVRVLRLERNGGPAPARNAGMRAAAHRYVLALDNDALPRPDVLRKLCAAMAGSPAIAIAQPRSVFEGEETRIHYDGGAFHYAGLISLRNFYRPLADAEGSGTVDVDCAVAVALLVDREALVEAGEYDEDYFILFEDLDLSYRLRALGKRIVSVEDAVVVHRGGTPGISFREGPRYPGSRVFYHSRNRWLFLAKAYRIRTLFVALPGLLVYEAAWFAFAVLAGGLGAWLRGKWGFLALLPSLGAKRRAFQGVRRRADRELLVGGPLTVTPAVGGSAAKRAFLAALDGLLRTWWRLARGLAG